jgi:hypothetical protein
MLRVSVLLHGCSPTYVQTFRANNTKLHAVARQARLEYSDHARAITRPHFIWQELMRVPRDFLLPIPVEIQSVGL